MFEMKKTNSLLSILFALIFAFSCVLSCSAEQNTKTNTYTYSNTGDIIFSPDIYDVQSVIYGDNFGIGQFVTPEDFMLGSDGNLYIADTGNNRVVIVSADGKSATVLKEFILPDGSVTELKTPQGVCITKQGTLYICDTENNRILCCDTNGKVSKIMTKPDSAYFSDTVEFIPTRVAVDSAGNLYVTATGTYQGMTMFSPEGNFIGFYGAEEVEATAEVIKDYLWKQFMTEEQRNEMSKYVPTEACNISISDNDFVLTVSNANYIPLSIEKTEMDHIRLLNPKGVNIIELDTENYPGKAIAEDAKYLNFIAGFVDENGFISIIDNSKGRVYQFDSAMNLMAVFGGIGNGQGLFGKPSDIDGTKDFLYVLDEQKGSITVFKRNDYGDLIYNALQIYTTAAQSDAIEPWREVLKQNANYDLAYVGIGRALLNGGDAKSAMEYFVKGHDSSLYNEAFQIYRTEMLRTYGPYIVLVLMIVIIALIVIIKKQKKYRLVTLQFTKFYRFKEAILHPSDGFERLHTTKTLSMPIALCSLALLAIQNFFEIQFTGKQFSMVNINEINLFWRICSVALVVVVWTLANWCICVLIEGKATLAEIFMFSCYSLIPYTVAGYIKIILSNFMIRQESMFISCLIAVGIIWSFIMIIQAFVYFHEFEGGVIVKALLLTVVGMAVIAILAFLVYMLAQQLISTVIIIVNEIQFSIRMG